MSRYARRIRPFVDLELHAAKLSLTRDPQVAFHHLERAHVLGQQSTILHVRAHWHMFCWGLRQSDFRECLGQMMRIVGAATKTAVGWVPRGNTGGSNVSPFKPMAVPSDLEEIMQRVSK